MLKQRNKVGVEGAQCNRGNAPKVLGYGLGTGAFSGFFGIGGGFLIVPGLIASTSMPMINAVGTSLVAVTAFGLITALNYGFSGLGPGECGPVTNCWRRASVRNKVRHTCPSRGKSAGRR